MKANATQLLARTNIKDQRGVIHHVELFVDMEYLLKVLSLKAVQNKSGKARYISGAIRIESSVMRGQK